MAAVSPAKVDWVFTEELRGPDGRHSATADVCHRMFATAGKDTEIRWATPPCNCAKLVLPRRNPGHAAVAQW